MPKYKYKALTLENRAVSGVLEARDEFDFRARMRPMELVPIRFREVGEQPGRYRLRADEAAVFCRQLAGMLGSGIPVARAVEILLKREKKPRLAKIYRQILKELLQGGLLSEAMRGCGRAFPELLVNMAASGEASGRLEQVLSKMAAHYQKEHRLNGKIRGAMTYPAMLFIVMLAVVMIIFTVVLPEFFTIFKDADLPAITRAMISISEFLQKWWYLAIAAIAAAPVGLAALFKMPAPRLWLDRAKLSAPSVGGLLETIYTARFARTLSSLYAGGIPILSALEICAGIIGNKYLEGQFPAVIQNIRRGEPLSESVGEVNGLDGKLATSMLIGEESGRLDAMLESIADDFDYEAEMASERLVRMLEPAMIAVMGVVVGVIMLSVMLPIFGLSSQVETM